MAKGMVDGGGRGGGEKWGVSVGIHQRTPLMHNNNVYSQAAPKVMIYAKQQ